MRRLRSSSPTPSLVAGEVASTSASTSRKRRKRNERKTGDEDVAVTQMKQQQEEKKNNNKAELPDELWLKVLEDVDDKSVTAFASASKQLRRVQKESGRRLKTNFKVYFYDLRTSQMYYDYSESIPIDKELAALSEDWCLWSMSSLTLK